jgi:hypothetical protein
LLRARAAKGTDEGEESGLQLQRVDNAQEGSVSHTSITMDL